MSKPLDWKGPKYAVGDIVVWDMDYIGSYLREDCPKSINDGPFVVLEIRDEGWRGVSVREIKAAEPYAFGHKNSLSIANAMCWKKDPFMTAVAEAISGAV